MSNRKNSPHIPLLDFSSSTPKDFLFTYKNEVYMTPSSPPSSPSYSFPFVTPPTRIRILDDRLRSDLYLPKTQTLGSAGIDLRVCNYNYDLNLEFEEEWVSPDSKTFPLTITSHRPFYVGTGISLEIPAGYVGLLIPRSSSSKVGVCLANTVGVVDSDYRGEVILALRHSGAFSENEKKSTYSVNELERIAQLVVVPCNVNFYITDAPLSSTDRGTDGFGHTGKI